MGIVATIMSLTILMGCDATDKTESQNEHSIEKSTINTSVQLWSVKDDLKTDFKGTLTQLADMGFNGVEFTGDLDLTKKSPQV